MTITNRVQGAFFAQEDEDARLIRLAPNAPPSKGPTRRQGTPWTHDEHERFLEAMEKYPSGPWKRISAHVGSRNTRQTMTHAQKYRQKIARWQRAGQSGTVSPPAQPSSPTDHMSITSRDEQLVDDDSEIWQAILGLDFELSDEEHQFPECLTSLLEGYEPLQLAHDVEMAEIDQQLAHFH